MIGPNMDDTIPTKVWEVDGFTIVDVCKGFRFNPTKLTVRYTSDKVGKTLSISDDMGGFMFQVPFDEIFKEICK